MPKASGVPRIHTLSRSEAYTFTKVVRPSLRLLEGLGVEGDVHCGATVKHRSRLAADPTKPNLRQVHLIQSELFDELADAGFEIEPGDLGENITTVGVDLLALPTGTQLTIGERARIEITGLRNPCGQINAFREGLLAHVRKRGESGDIIRRAGVMAIVSSGGDIEAGDPIEIEWPTAPHRARECV